MNPITNEPCDPRHRRDFIAALLLGVPLEAFFYAVARAPEWCRALWREHPCLTVALLATGLIVAWADRIAGWWLR